MTIEEASPDGAQNAAEAPISSFRKYAPRVGVSLFIAGGFVWLFHRGGLPLLPPREALSTLAWWAVPGFALLTALATFLRVHRWVPLLRAIQPDVASDRVCAIGLVGVGAIMFAPLRMGEAVRPYLLMRERQVSFLQAVGAAGAERVVDGLVLICTATLMLRLGTPLSPLPDHLGNMPLPVSLIPRALQVMSIVFVGAFIALAFFYAARDFAHRLVHRLLNPISPKLASFVTSTFERLSDGLRVLGSKGNRGRFFGETLGYWACAFGGQWLLLRGAGIPVGLPEACVTLGALGLGVIVPAGPGLFGAYQIGVYSGLALFFPMAVLQTSGAAAVFVSYATQLVISALGGGGGLFWLSRNPARAPQRAS